MVTPTLAFDAVFAAAAAFVYAYVGELTRRRPAHDAEGRRALVMFSVWWYGLAAATLVGSVQSALGAMGLIDVSLFIALALISVPLIVAILWGLVYYLLYIYTGRASLFWPVFYFHVALLVALTYLVVWRNPTSVVAGDWNVSVQYERAVTGPLGTIVILGILGPVLFAALGYATLLFRAKDATTRYRVASVAGAFILWFGSSAVAASTPLGKWYWWPIAARTIALVSTIIILMAYRPPRVIRERFGVQAVEIKPRPGSDTLRRVMPVAWRLRTRA